MEVNNLKIAEGEKLYLDGVELKNVSNYTLQHSAGDLAELTVMMEVTVNQFEN